MKSAMPPPLTTPLNNSSGNETFASAYANAYMSNFMNIIAPGMEPCMTKEYKPQMAYELPNYLNPQTLKRHILHSDKMRHIIETYASAENCASKKIEKQVQQILDEIGLERNLAIIRWCGMAITAIGKRILKGIYVNAASMQEVKRDLGKNPVLYLPSHRSYMDFILMSYICFYFDIEIPGIAAGMDFHSMFGMGTMLRKTGAFFMRRSFSNDELYWDVFREYMYALVSVYHIGVEFFIEGTRSRNFKALVPKIGLLSMALLPYFTGEITDVTIVPVSISYERVLEEQLFVYELLGVPKPKESTKGFFKALKIIDEKFGKMFVDFGKPISAREFFQHTTAERMQRATVGAQLQKLHKHDIELVKKLANEIIYQQQRRIVINTFNLLSLYFASQLYMQRTVNIDEISRAITALKCIFEELGAHVSSNMNAIKVEIIETVEIHSNILHFENAQLHFTQVAVAQLAQQVDTKRLKAHALLPHTMAVAVPALALQLYINPCLFWLVRPAYVILAAMQLQKLETSNFKSYNELLLQLQQRVDILDEIFKHEFIVESNREAAEFSSNLQFLLAHKVLSISQQTLQVTVQQNDCCHLLLSALAPFLCMYYQLAVTLNLLPSQTTSNFGAKDVLIQLQQRVERLLLQQPDATTTLHAKHVHPYCLALDNLNIALNSFVQTGYLLRNKDTGDLQLAADANGLPLLRCLEAQLLQYCELMPFKQYFEAAESTWLTAKL